MSSRARAERGRGWGFYVLSCFFSKNTLFNFIFVNKFYFYMNSTLKF